MLYRILFLLVLMSSQCLPAKAQLIYFKEKIVSPYTIKDEKAERRRERLIEQASSLNYLNLDSNEGEIGSALWAISQFLLRTPQSDSGIQKLVNNFDRLNPTMQRGLMEVMYGLYPTEFATAVKKIVRSTNQPKLFAQSAAYLYRYDAALAHWLQQQLTAQFPGYASQHILVALSTFLAGPSKTPLPSFDSLFAHQQVHGYKVVYSFQRSNRDFTGLAVVQLADGSFARDSSGQLKTFVQLARSASNLPYFITNGNTPQGLYTITGTGISKNVFIGPTPNLQMSMMYEVNTPQFTHYFPIVFNAPPEKIYRSYFPANWQNWSGLMEAHDAGKIGRSEIIAHGTTIDPNWFKGHPYYPVSPTLGCLCGREIWDGKTGRISYSDQLDLVNTFIETAGTQGYLMVIDIGNEAAPVSAAEIRAIVDRFEKPKGQMPQWE